MSEEGINQLASYLQQSGLRATARNTEELAVANPISSTLNEVVTYTQGRYVTAWGYEVGQDGDERAAASRLAFLLGVPTKAAS